MSFSRGSRFDRETLVSHCENYPNQLENIAQKERFGLFSQPPGLSIGDNFGRGKGKQEPRGILTNPKLASSVEPSLFQFPNFTSINDPYKEPFKGKQIVDKQREQNIPHAQPFKQTDNIKTIIGSEYQHMKEYDDKSYDTRHPDGSVKIKPRGFYTQPYKKGTGNSTVGHLFGHYAHAKDPYERPEEFEVQDRANHKSKILNINKPFVGTQQKNQLFNSNIDTYGNYRPLPEGRKQSYDYKGATHTGDWKPGNPAKQGYNKTLSQFPAYLEEGQPRRQKKKQPFVKHEKTWKPNSKGTFARPTPAISHLVTNFKQMTSFRK